MTQFWRLFTSDYIQDFVDSKPIPTKDELVETYTSQFDKVLDIHKRKVNNFFQKVPSFQQFIAIVKNPALLQGKAKTIASMNSDVESSNPIYSNEVLDVAYA